MKSMTRQDATGNSCNASCINDTNSSKKSNRRRKRKKTVRNRPKQEQQGKDFLSPHYSNFDSNTPTRLHFPAILSPAASNDHDECLSRVLHDRLLCPTPEASIQRTNAMKELNRLVDSWLRQQHSSDSSLPNDGILHQQQQRQQQQQQQQSFCLVPFGSYALEVWNPRSDLDILLLTPHHITRDSFFHQFVPLLESIAASDTTNDPIIQDVHPLPNAYTPVCKFRLFGISVDLLFCSLRNDSRLKHYNNDPSLDYQHKHNLYPISDLDLMGLMEPSSIRSLNGARVSQVLSNYIIQPYHKPYTQALRFLKSWAQQKGLYSNVLGFLGGINYAILLAYVVIQLEKEQQLQHQHNDSTTKLNLSATRLIHKFFGTFAHWDWPMPVQLPLESLSSNIVEEIPSIPSSLGSSSSSSAASSILSEWNPQRNKRDRYHITPILTPVHPTMNSAYNVGVPQQRRWTREFKRALSKVEQIMNSQKATVRDWEGLLEPPTDFFGSHDQYIQIEIQGGNPRWFRFVESKLRILIARLEDDKGLSSSLGNGIVSIEVEPFAKFFQSTSSSSIWFVIPLRLSQRRTKKQVQGSNKPSTPKARREPLQISSLPSADELLEMVESWDERQKGTDEIRIEFVAPDELHECIVLEEGNTVTSTNIVTLTTDSQQRNIINDSDEEDLMTEDCSIANSEDKTEDTEPDTVIITSSYSSCLGESDAMATPSRPPHHARGVSRTTTSADCMTPVKPKALFSTLADGSIAEVGYSPTSQSPASDITTPRSFTFSTPVRSPCDTRVVTLPTSATKRSASSPNLSLSAPPYPWSPYYKYSSKGNKDSTHASSTNTFSPMLRSPQSPTPTSLMGPTSSKSKVITPTTVTQTTVSSSTTGYPPLPYPNKAVQYDNGIFPESDETVSTRSTMTDEDTIQSDLLYCPEEEHQIPFSTPSSKITHSKSWSTIASCPSSLKVKLGNPGLTTHTVSSTPPVVQTTTTAVENSAKKQISQVQHILKEKKVLGEAQEQKSSSVGPKHPPLSVSKEKSLKSKGPSPQRDTLSQRVGSVEKTEKTNRLNKEKVFHRPPQLRKKEIVKRHPASILISS